MIEQTEQVSIREHIWRKDAPLLTIFLSGIEEQGDQKLRCIFCAFPFYETRNGVVRVAFDEGHIDQKNGSGKVRCKRCKQTYHIVS